MLKNLLLSAFLIVTFLESLYRTSVVMASECIDIVENAAV